MPVLKIEDGGGKRVVKISGEHVTIGRLPENDIVLTAIGNQVAAAFRNIRMQFKTIK